MPAPATVDEFLDLVQKSGVAEPAKLNPYVQRLKDSKALPTEPSKLAGLLVRDALLTYFQAEQILQGKWKRFFIGKYKVLERLGIGGMGQVFLCEHKLMRRRVAVKVLPTAKAADPSSLQRFYREARAVAALDHPNIVRAYDIDQDENLHFLVMEFVDGTNLQDLVKKFGPLDVLRACHYVYGSAVGLQYAFEMGIVHRDIKPGNVLVDRSGVVKILDMGLARFFNDEEDQLTKKYDENVLGTADYLAPEQAVESHTVDIRADVYSLGGTFYFLLTGQPPFPEGSVAQKLLWHQTRDPKPVRQLRPEVPAELAAVLARMMAKEPADRFQTPAELMTALARWVQTPIPPPPDKEMPQFSPAALGGPGGPAVRPMSSGVLLAGSGPFPVGPGLSTGSGQQPIPAAVARATPGPRAGAAVPTHQPPAADHPGGVWEALAAETRANAGAETGSARRSTRRPPPAAAPPDQPKRARVAILLAAAGLLLLLAGGGYALYRAFTPRDRGHPPTPKVGSAVTEPRTWYVARAGGGPHPDQAVSTLLAAVQKAGPGDTIAIIDDQIDDPPLRLDAARMRLKDLTIEAGNDQKSVRWTPAGAGAAAAALEVVGVDGLRVRGLVIDAPGRFEYGVSVSGHVPGLVVEDVTVRGPRVAGFRLANVTGEADRPALLARVRVSAAAPLDAGVLFAGDVRQTTRHAHLAGGRVDGPARAGVRVEGSAADVEVRHTRVYNVDAGVVLAGLASPTTPLTVKVVGNTFHTVRDAGVRVDVRLPTDLPHEIVVAQNYFARTTALAKVPPLTAPPPGLKADTNARDEQSKEGTLPLQAEVVAGPRLGTNPANDETFLRYPPGGPLSAVGPRLLPVGVPPR
jgi:hypothetical protein